MRFISHRGNVCGPDEDKENHPDYLRKALDEGWEVEVDVWLENGELVLGHDEPLYGIEVGFLQDSRVWCHCKNLGALVRLEREQDIHYFSHHADPYTLTSAQYIWVYPGNPVPRARGILVMPETCPLEQKLRECAGVCSDYIVEYKETFQCLSSGNTIT